MSLTVNTGEKMSRSPVIESLADQRRRALLRIVLDRVSPVAERELAIHLAATEQGKSLVDATEDEVQAIRAGLCHVQLPALEEADLVDWDRGKETVTATGHPALSDPHFQRIIETEAPGWSAVVANLADTQRRVVLAVLTGHDGPLSRSELAHEVLTRTPGGDPQSDMEALAVSLHHVHLPKLADAGLVEYDVDTESITYQGHPELADEWLDFPDNETSGTMLTAVHE